MRESVSNQSKGKVSELSRGLILCISAWDTQKIYTSASLSGLQAESASSSTGPSTMSWCFLQFFVLVVQALAFDATVDGLLQVCV